MSIIIILFMLVFSGNLIICQTECYNLQFANKLWFKKDSIVSVNEKSNDYTMSINYNNNYIINIKGKFLNLQLCDILGNKVEYEYNQNESSINIYTKYHNFSPMILLINIQSIGNNKIYSKTLKILQNK